MIISTIQILGAIGKMIQAEPCSRLVALPTLAAFSYLWLGCFVFCMVHVILIAPFGTDAVLSARDTHSFLTLQRRSRPHKAVSSTCYTHVAGKYAPADDSGVLITAWAAPMQPDKSHPWETLVSLIWIRRRKLTPKRLTPLAAPTGNWSSLMNSTSMVALFTLVTILTGRQWTFTTGVYVGLSCIVLWLLC
jgi:hypothetical protein